MYRLFICTSSGDHILTFDLSGMADNAFNKLCTTLSYQLRNKERAMQEKGRIPRGFIMSVTKLY